MSSAHIQEMFGTETISVSTKSYAVAGLAALNDTPLFTDVTDVAVAGRTLRDLITDPAIRAVVNYAAFAEGTFATPQTGRVAVTFTFLGEKGASEQIQLPSSVSQSGSDSFTVSYDDAGMVTTGHKRVVYDTLTVSSNNDLQGFSIGYGFSVELYPLQAPVPPQLSAPAEILPLVDNALLPPDFSWPLSGDTILPPGFSWPLSDDMILPPGFSWPQVDTVASSTPVFAATGIIVGSTSGRKCRSEDSGSHSRCP